MMGTDSNRATNFEEDLVNWYSAGRTPSALVRSII